MAGESAALTDTGAGFIPQAGFSYSGSPTDGGTFTITGPPGSFGAKPVSAKPLLWIDPHTTGNLNPSPLGRTTALVGVANFSYQGSGGPGGGAYAKGAPVVTGDAGTQKQWTAGFDVTQWGAGSPSVNDYSAKYYRWRTKYRNWGQYLETNGYNIKVYRCWTLSGSTQTYPNFYFASSNWTLGVEDSSGGTWGTYTPTPDFPRAGQGSGTPDQNAIDNVTAFSGGLPGTPNAVTFDNWFSEEIITRANANDPGSHPPLPDATSMYFGWFVEGLNSNNAAFATPVDTYQWNEWYIQAPTIDLTGGMVRDYPWHDLIDGSGGRNMIPVGSYVGYGPTYVDDSWCRAHVRDHSARASFTMTEIQIPSAWSDTSITLTLRKGRFGAFSGKSLIITDDGGVEHYVGDFA